MSGGDGGDDERRTGWVRCEEFREIHAASSFFLLSSIVRGGTWLIRPQCVVISVMRNYDLFVYAMCLSVPRSSLVCLPGAAGLGEKCRQLLTP